MSSFPAFFLDPLSLFATAGDPAQQYQLGAAPYTPYPSAGGLLFASNSSNTSSGGGGGGGGGSPSPSSAPSAELICGVERCCLLGGFVSYCVQGGLGVAALTSLLYKRHVERPVRHCKVWLMDVSKQGLSALVAHFLNVLLAYIFSLLTPASDQCAWYFVNFTIDTVVGVFIVYLLLKLLECAAARFRWRRVLKSGDYGRPPSLKTWCAQLTSWTLIIIVMKALLTGLIILARNPLDAFGGWVFRPLRDAKLFYTELTLVMIIGPCLMNVIQFWIQDTFLKRHKPKRSSLEGGDGLGSPPRPGQRVPSVQMMTSSLDLTDPGDSSRSLLEDGSGRVGGRKETFCGRYCFTVGCCAIPYRDLRRVLCKECCGLFDEMPGEDLFVRSQSIVDADNRVSRGRDSLRNPRSKYEVL
eukprot:g1824.t1